MTKISSEQATQMVQGCYQSKHYKQATRILQWLVQHGVQDDRIHLLMGNVHYCLGQYIAGHGVFVVCQDSLLRSSRLTVVGA